MGSRLQLARAGDAVALADVSHAWVASGPRLLRTGGGGVTWMARRWNARLLGLSALTLPPPIQWAMHRRGWSCADDYRHAIILRTYDGAASWSPSLPMLMGSA